MKAQPGAQIEPRDLEPRTGDATVMNWIAGTSPRHLARIAGGLYLIIIVGGFFAIGFVPPARRAQRRSEREAGVGVIGSCLQ